MLQKRAFRYSLFALLYFAQGSILSYFAALNALHLRSFGLSMSKIGLFSAIAALNLLAVPLLRPVFGPRDAPRS